ncbi:MAG: sensor histidine kinase [Solirubrobacterales bacterium]
MVSGWPSWSGARLLLVISGTCAALAVAVMALVVKVDYDGTIREAEGRNAVLAQILEEHARRSFDISKAALLDLSDHVLVDGKLTVTPPLAARMKRWIHDIPGISSFWLIDDQGRAVYVTIPQSTEGYNFADRAYFKAHAAGEEFYVSPMTLGKIDRKWFFSLSKRIVDSDGRFRGLLIASIQTEFFVSTYAKLGLAPADNIAIYKTDGMTVVRRLENWEGEVAPSNAKSALFTTMFPQKPVGIYESTSPIDGIRRIIAYRSVEGWPLVVASGSERQGVLRPWYKRTTQNVTFCGVVLLVLGGLTFWSYRRVRSEELALSKHAVLLNEVHHRVKNNLAIVQSLLMLEANRAAPEAQAGYRDSIARVEAMGLVHHLLYDHQSFEGIQAADYLHRLCEGLERSAGGVRIHVDAEPVETPLDCAVPMALIANEIITNAVKHAYPEGGAGDVFVSLRKDGGAVRLRIADNGGGLSATAAAGKETGLGMMLVRQLTRQLRGEFVLESDGGTVFTLTFPSLLPG